MSQSPSDSYPGEKTLKADVQEAIHRAVESEIENQNREITRLEEEKLTIFAIQDRDLDLTYSYYLAGGVTAVGDTSTSQTPESPGIEFGSLSAESSPSERVARLQHYFETSTFFDSYNLKQVWWTDRWNFLKDYYRTNVPSEYRDLYLISLQIRNELSNLSNNLDASTTSGSLADYGAVQPRALQRADEERIRRLISELHLELGGIDLLSGTVEPVTKGTDLIEEVLFKLTEIEEVSAGQQRVLDKLSELFFYYIWKYPALRISAETAQGPNSTQLSNDRDAEFSDFETTYLNTLSEYTRMFARNKLLPQTEDFEETDLEVDGNILFIDEGVNQTE